MDTLTSEDPFTKFKEQKVVQQKIKDFFTGLNYNQFVFEFV